MKRFLLVLSIMMLVLCLGACLVACGDNGNPPADTGTGTGTGGGNGGTQDDSITYTVTVVDQFGNPVKDVNLQVCHGDGDGSCLRADKTDENGIKTYSVKEALVSPRVLINSAPENSVYPSEYVYFDEGKTEITVTIELKDKYTFSAKNQDGTVAYEGVKFFIYKSAGDAELVGTAITGADGTADIVVDPFECYVVVEHPNDAFTLTNGTDENKVNSLENCSFDAVFAESTDPIEYSVEVKTTDAAAVEGAEVSFYDASYNYINKVTTDAQGVASISGVNGSYYAVVSVDQKSATAVVFEKNLSNKGVSTVTNNTPGTFKTNAIIVLKHLDVTVAAGQSLWLYLPDANGSELVFDSIEGIEITNADGTYENGTIIFEVEGSNGYFKIKNTTTTPLVVTATRETK